MIIKNSDFTKNEVDKNTFLSHAVLESINKEVFNTKQFKEDKETEIILTINGLDCDIHKFFEQLENNFKWMVDKKAKEIVKEHFDIKLFNILDDITSIADDLQERLNDKIENELKYTWE